MIFRNTCTVWKFNNVKMYCIGICTYVQYMYIYIYTYFYICTCTCIWYFFSVWFSCIINFHFFTKFCLLCVKMWEFFKNTSWWLIRSSWFWLNTKSMLVSIHYKSIYIHLHVHVPVPEKHNKYEQTFVLSVKYD